MLKRLAEQILLFLRQTDRKLLIAIGCGIVAAALFGTLYGHIFRPDHPASEWQYLSRYVEDGGSSLHQQEGSLTVEEKSLDVIPAKLSADTAAGEKATPRAAAPVKAPGKSSGGLRVQRSWLGGDAQYGEVTVDSRQTTEQYYREQYGDDWQRAIKRDIIFDMQNKSPENFNSNWGEFGDYIGELESMSAEEKEALLQEKLRER